MATLTATELAGVRTYCERNAFGAVYTKTQINAVLHIIRIDQLQQTSRVSSPHAT